MKKNADDSPLYTDQEKHEIIKALNNAIMNEVITKVKLGQCLKISNLYFTMMNKESQWEKIPRKFWTIIGEWFNEDPRATLREFGLRRENNSLDRNFRSDLETVGAVEEGVVAGTVEEKPQMAPKVTKKGYMSGTAHKTKNSPVWGKHKQQEEKSDTEKTPEGSSQEAIEVLEKAVEAASHPSSTMTLVDKHETPTYSDSDWGEVIQERDGLKIECNDFQEIAEHRQITIDDLEGQLKEERYANQVLTDQLTIIQQNHRNLQTEYNRLKELPFMKPILGVDDKVEMVIVTAPMQLLYDAIKKLEEMKFYVEVTVEYDTPAGKHSE